LSILNYHLFFLPHVSIEFLGFDQRSAAKVTLMLSLISQVLTSLVTFLPLWQNELLPNKGFVVEPGESIL